MSWNKNSNYNNMHGATIKITDHLPASSAEVTNE
jgi:hypothetical protein